MVKFLIIRFSSIGDIVLTTPVVRCLKYQVPDAEIHYLTKKIFLPVMAANPNIDRFHIIENNLHEVIHHLRSENFDYIIDLHNNIRSVIVKSRLRIMSFTVNKINFKKWLMVNLKVNRLPDKHIVDRYLETLHAFDIGNDHRGLDFFLTENDEVDLKVLPDFLREGFIVLVVGAKHGTKQVPVDKLALLCQNIRKPIVLLGGPEDLKISKILEDLLPGKQIYNGCGKFKINQSASLVKQSNLVITPDTGLMHIAAAFKKSILSVWGSTIPEFGMYPYYPDPTSRIYEVKGLSCRPCSRIGLKECPKKHFRCMKDINYEEIAEMANRDFLAEG